MHADLPYIPRRAHALLELHDPGDDDMPFLVSLLFLYHALRNRGHELVGVLRFALHAGPYLGDCEGGRGVGGVDGGGVGEVEGYHCVRLEWEWGGGGMMMRDGYYVV